MVTAAMKLKDTCSFGKESTCNVGDLVAIPRTQKELDVTERLSHTHTHTRMHLGRKAVTNLDSILKSRDISLPTEVLLVIVMVFPVVMYGYLMYVCMESWSIKKAEHQ